MEENESRNRSGPRSKLSAFVHSGGPLTMTFLHKYQYASNWRSSQRRAMSNTKPFPVFQPFTVALEASYKNLKLIVTTMVLVLLPCELLLALTEHIFPPLFVIDLNPLLPSDVPITQLSTKIELRPVSFVLRRLSMVAMACLSVTACSRLEKTSRTQRIMWWRPATTLLCAELFKLLPMLVIIAVVRIPGLLETIAHSFDSGLWVLFIGLSFSYFICFDSLVWWSLVVSVVEQGQGCSGMGAIARAVAFVMGRKLRVFVLTLLLVPLGLLSYNLCGPGPMTMTISRGIVVMPICITGRVYEWLVYTLFYYSHKKSH